MAKFFVGQRVRILWSAAWPELAGQPGTVIGRVGPDAEAEPECEWDVAPDPWGSHTSPHADGRFSPHEGQIEPISDSNQLSSWEAMKELWTPERLGEVV